MDPGAFSKEFLCFEWILLFSQLEFLFLNGFCCFFFPELLCFERILLLILPLVFALCRFFFVAGTVVVGMDPSVYSIGILI